MRTRSTVCVLLLSIVGACGGGDTPVHGAVVLTHDARRATLTGTAGGTRPTIDLAPGCAGFVADGPPDQVVVVREPMKLDFVARSTRGPVALLVVGDDGGLCDGDGGTGHAPAIHTVGAGRYRVWVASMQARQRLPYELTVAPPSKPDAAGSAGGGPAVASTGTVSVTVMSTPAGAEVRSPTGQVLGTTPAMFEYPASAQPSATLAFVVAAPGAQAATVSGVPMHGELVLNAVLASQAPVIPNGRDPLVGATTLVASVPQHIRDYGTATQTIAWPDQCVIQNIAVDTVIRHTCLSDLRVRLTSPTGTVMTLHDHAYRNTLSRTFTTSDAHGALGHAIGQNAQGTWTMTVRDDVDADSGTFQSFTLHIVCQGGATATLPLPAAGGGTLGLRTTGAMAPVVDPFAGALGATAHAGVLPIAAARGGPEVIDPWH